MCERVFTLFYSATVVGNVTQPAPNTELPVTPTFTIVTSIWNYADTQERTSGFVSEQLRWKISGPGIKIIEHDGNEPQCEKKKTRPVQSQKKARILKFWILLEYQCSENTDADQLHS